MTIMWPETLPQSFLHSGYSEKIPDNLQRTFILKGGPEPTRKITTSNPVQVHGNMVMTKAQIATLDSFYKVTTVFGVLPFYFKYHLTSGKYPTEFSKPPTWKLVGDDVWAVNLFFEMYTNHPPLQEEGVQVPGGGVVPGIGGGVV